MSTLSTINGTGSSDARASDEEVLLGHIATVIDARWWIAATAVAAIVLGAIYVVLATPVFRSDVLIQIEEKQSGLGALDDLSNAFSTHTPAETEMEILRSRSLVGAVVEDLRLDVVVKPRRFPIVGNAISRRRRSPEPVLGLGSYAWGPERVQVDYFVVPRELEEEKFTLRFDEADRFTLISPDGDPVGSARVGEELLGNVYGAGEVKLKLTSAVARPGVRFSILKNRLVDTIEKLQKAMVISEKGRKTGIIRVALDGEDPVRLASVLNGIATRYLRQNVERKAEEASVTLAFLNTQLPLLKTNLEAAERALNEYRTKHRRIDLSLEAEAALKRSVEVEASLAQMQVQRAGLRQRFTESHPEVASLNRQLRQLEEEKRSIEQTIKTLPDAELESTRLLRDVKVANEMYVLVLNKAEELKVVRSGTIGNVRIVDSALLPDRAVSPRFSVVLTLAALLGVALGCAGAIGRKVIGGGVDDPEHVEKATGLSIYATIPHSERQDDVITGEAGHALAILAATDPKDLAVESVRSLRTSLQFALADARNNVVAIGGPSPSIGKTFVSSNLAYLIAEAGKRVILVDGDLRRGRLHTVFGVGRSRGLADVLAGTVELDEAIRSFEGTRLGLLTTGSLPPNPSELLMSDKFARLVNDLAERYDIVIIDAPPLLAVSDALVIARHASANLQVLRAGRHKLREITYCVKRLRQAGIEPSGFVINDVPALSGLGRNGYRYHYQYDYR